ncbi:peptide chain release factor N(5)-glutamine methyltransferase [Devosia sp. ZB163]|uniref:peptide chain release factor N(5)-glutamine methyltransferase n=1 Tax=Devosia sp. ZB163 TaxID=3025938 RepID=UPI0023608F4F|nr:peptide chain release factor N(5)-glutamine methyltransferase [Devosia sp. ZB163]MDC9826558.1 peptide chain release factor N(5)-glutamine methyltransferase [Devosia sp. ZB163]
MGAAWRGVRDQFRRAGIDTAELDARLFAEAAFGMDRLELVNREREAVPQHQLSILDDYAARRLKGEPVVRILGEKEFWGLSFKLNAATLVPRPETEMLVERGLEVIGPLNDARVLDLGTGTGCIPISLLTEYSDVTAVAVDLSVDALEIARLNANRHGVGDRFTTLKGSWFDPLDPGQRFDLITSNPPYIESADIETLMPEVREHDPRLALDGGSDGLDAYRAIAAEAGHFLKPEGVLLLEMGTGQGQAVHDLLVGAGFGEVEIVRDYGGHDRMAVARLRTAP